MGRTSHLAAAWSFLAVITIIFTACTSPAVTPSTISLEQNTPTLPPSGARTVASTHTPRITQAPDKPSPSSTPLNTLPAPTPLPVLENCSLALIAPDQENQSITALQSGINETAAAIGCKVEVVDSGSSPADMANQLRSAAQKNVQGIILVPLEDIKVEQAVKEVSTAGVPVVLIGPETLPGIQANRVVPDLADGARKAADFICRAIQERGRVIQLAQGQPELAQAFTSQIQRSCPNASVITIPVKNSEAGEAHRALLQQAAKDRDVSAVFATTGSSIQEASKALVESGLLGVFTIGIGEDLDIGGMDELGAVNGAIQWSDRGAGKAAVLAILAQVMGAKAVEQIPAEMDVRTSDISFQLPPDLTARPLNIGVILMGESEAFTREVYRGLMSPAMALDNVKLKIHAAATDRSALTEELDWMAQADINAVLLAVENPAGLELSEILAQTDLPVVTLGASMADPDIISQIRFDDYAAGYRAGEFLCSASEGQGTLLDVFSSSAGSAESLRSQGLMDYQKESCPSVKIVPVEVSANPQTACLDLEKRIEIDPSVSGIFAHSEKLALCDVWAAENQSETWDVIGVGASAGAIQAVRDGRISAAIGQYHYEMGVIAMETTISYLYGQPVEADKPFPVNVITREMLN